MALLTYLLYCRHSQDDFEKHLAEVGTSFAELATYLGDEDVKEPTELELDSHLLGLQDSLDSLHSLHLLHVLHSLHLLHVLHFLGADRARTI